ncbi:Inositol hexakisphosphate kinase 1 [Nakaseomyces bracarensis]|uniref:Kinase n=1 Tax=Nakaseomyces bracarensis TaxID=273131 RepID=A0ABR4NMR3_9SACH
MPANKDGRSHSSHARINDAIKSLKDLNISNKKKLAPVLHGRKASTYLRIFQDDDDGIINSEHREERWKKSMKSIEDKINEKPSIRRNHDLRQRRPSRNSVGHIPMGRRNSAYNQQRQPNKEALQSIYNLSSTGVPSSPPATNPIFKRTVDPNRSPRYQYRKLSPHRGEKDLDGLPPHEVNREWNNFGESFNTPKVGNLHNYSLLDSSPKHKANVVSALTPLHGKEESAEDLSLKPVSSATYYPHKSKEKRVSNGSIVDNNTNLVDTTCRIGRGSNSRSLDQKRPEFTISPSSDIIDVVTESPKGGDINKDIDQKLLEEVPKVKRSFDENAIDDSSEVSETDEDEENRKEYPLAVELKPFTNNVGGHTAIFRFSKRAVCKALVNRENKFYENIELNHQELLPFMPRYIGVLNVRQHFYSNDDVINELASKHKKQNIEDLQSNFSNTRENSNLENLEIGTALTHIHSFPIEKQHRSVSCKDHSTNQQLPEVVLNDNRHIIPDSLWGRYSHSPSSLPGNSPNSYLSSRSYDEQRMVHPGISVDNMEEYRNHNGDSGFTMVNTELKDAVLEEVFAPIYSRRHHKQRSHNNIHINTEENPIPNSVKRSMIYDSIRRDSDTVVNTSTPARNDSPLLNQNVKDSIGNALDTSHSVMDLKQFKKTEEIKEEIRNKANDNAPKFLSSSKMAISTSISSVETSRSKQECEDDNGVFMMDDENAGFEHTKSKNNEMRSFSRESNPIDEQEHTIVSKFILLEDLTRNLKKPCALDLKMGTRQYGVDAKESKQRSQRAKCHKTTSRRLGVRICGLKVWDQDYYIKRDKYFGRRVRTGWQFARVIARFLYDGKHKGSIIKQIPYLIHQLETLNSHIHKLQGYRLYGASLLLMYDGSAKSNGKDLDPDNDYLMNHVGKAKVNLIDFARCVTKEDVKTGLSTFKIPPKTPDIEDKGFLRGVKSLKFYLYLIWNYLTNDKKLPDTESELRDWMSANKETVLDKWDWIDSFDMEDENEFNNSDSELRKKWRKYELIFDAEPRYNNFDPDISD